MVHELPISFTYIAYQLQLHVHDKDIPYSCWPSEKSHSQMYERLTNLSHELLHITHISTITSNVFSKFEQFQKAINPIDDYLTCKFGYKTFSNG